MIKIIWILIAVLLGIIVLAAGIALIITTLFFGNVWKLFWKEFEKKWKEREE